MANRRHGLVLGKFLPPHGGHHELVDYALTQCERVTVLVLGSKTEGIPLPLRREWMRARHPAARVVAGWDEIPVDFDDPHVHDLHIELMERLLNEPIDAVFTGEGYGDLLAERWGVEHVCRPRSGLISGTQVRADPAAFWDQLTPARARLPVPARGDHGRGVDRHDDARPRAGRATGDGAGCRRSVAP